MTHLPWLIYGVHLWQIVIIFGFGLLGGAIIVLWASRPRKGERA
jgi:hypothetical protein